MEKMKISTLIPSAIIIAMFLSCSRQASTVQSRGTESELRYGLTTEPAILDTLYTASLTEIDEAKRIGLYKEAQRVISSEAASVFIQDIYYPKVSRGGVFSGVLDYPLYISDFSPIYGID